MAGLRIAMVCPYSFAEPGGVQNHVLGLAGWLTANGDQVDICGPGHADPARLIAHGLRPGQFTSLGRSLPVRYNGSVARITFGPRTHFRVGAWLNRIAPDVIHVHEPMTPSAAVHAVWQANAPVVATFHTATPGSRSMRLAKRTMPGTIAAIAAGIAVSQVARRVVGDHIGLDPVVIGNGITVADHLHRLPVQGWRGGDRARITFIGRYDEPRKGFETFVQAIEVVRRRHPLADIVVAGHGSPRSVPGVRFVGRLSDAERNRLLTTSDLYVAPHLGRESFGIVLLEALASGTPVVASDLPAFTELLDDGQGPIGRIVPAGDSASLAGAIHASLTDPDCQARRGRLRAEQFDWSRIAPKVRQVFTSVITTSADEHSARAS